jgi:hypothetical protein
MHKWTFGIGADNRANSLYENLRVQRQLKISHFINSALELKSVDRLQWANHTKISWRNLRKMFRCSDCIAKTRYTIFEQCRRAFFRTWSFFNQLILIKWEWWRSLHTNHSNSKINFETTYCFFFEKRIRWWTAFELLE